MSYVRIWVHLVFTTKNREPFLKKENRSKVFNHISENCEEKEIFLLAINGHHDHVHCLISLGREQTIAKVAQMIKGESSFWINKNKIIPHKFMWQDDYYVNSVSDSVLPKVLYYIKNQEQHHSKKTFQEEVESFFEKSDFRGELDKKKIIELG